MAITRTRLISLAAGALALYACGGMAKADSGSGGSTTDQVVLGKKITKDEKIAALVPADLHGTLRVATAVPYPPFEYFDDNNALTGIDIDITRAVAAKMGVKVTFDNVKFDGVIPGVQAHKYDVIASSMGDTAEREKVLNFIDYGNLGNVLMVRGSDRSINGLIDLCGKTVTRQSGDVFASFIARIQPQCRSAGKSEVSIKTLPDSNAALLAIKSGSADAQVAGMAAAESLISAKENGGGQFRIVKPADKPHGWSPTNSGFGVLKSETKLTAAIEAATKAIKADGTLKAIAEHYGQANMVIDKVVVNAPVQGPM